MLVGGCYRSHGLDAGDLSDGDLPDSRVRDSGSGDGARPDGAPVDSGRRDSGFLDSGRPDTGAPDAGLPDGGVLTRCATDSDCSGACVRAPGVAAVDLARLDLACGPATAASSDGALCDTNADCGRGLCVVAGSCVAPCVVDGDCGPRQRCTELWVRTSSSALQWLNGCVDRVNAPPDVHVSRGRAGVVRGFAQSAEFRADTAGELAAWVTAQGTDDVLTGGAGNDTMSGGMLSDAFVFSTSMRGHDTVVDLEAWDTLRFEGFGYTSDAEARANLYQQGANVIFADQAVGATFLDTTLAMFTDDMIQV